MITAKGNSTFMPVLTFACSSVGMVLCFTALVLLLLTALLFTEWRQSYKNQLLIQFMIARFFYTGVRYIYDVADVFLENTGYFTPVFLDVLPMGYSEMALVTWMFVFSKQMYDSFVRVFVTTTGLRKISLCAWLIPGVISVLLRISHNLPIENHLKYFLIYLLILKWPVLIANGVLLISVLKSILITNKSKIESNPRIIVVMVILIFTFSCQQAILDTYKLTYLIFNRNDNSKCTTPLFFIFFNIITVYHCAFSILFWLFANKRTRILWGFSKEKAIVRVQQNLGQVTCYTTSWL